MATCIRCRQGFTWECTRGCQTVNATGTEQVTPPVDTTNDSENDLEEYFSEDDDESTGGPVREIRKQNDHRLKDQQSTGRKRAAEMYPLDREAPCEWRLKSNCGGGQKPITGCMAGTQQARHHGPDKNTLNNEQGNVHRICHTCHNRWHTENDPGYVWDAFHEPHSPTKCEPVDVLMSEKYWATRSVVKARD